MQELLRVLMATKESQEIERKRRLAWEQEQEAKYTQRQAEMERQMLEMRHEIVSLKASIGGTAKTDLRQQPMSAFGSPTMQQPTPQSSLSPISTFSHIQTQPTFVQGSSNRPFQQPTPSTAQTPSPNLEATNTITTRFITVEGSQLHPDAPSRNLGVASRFIAVEGSLLHPDAASPNTVTIETPASRFISVEGSQLHPDAPSPNPRKRPTPVTESSEDDQSSGSDSDEAPPQQALKRRSGHDKRCLTIQVYSIARSLSTICSNTIAACRSCSLPSCDGDRKR